jgi:glyoxylase-like metal-dependent hydrolase (beta-lactamase superfamily II)
VAKYLRTSQSRDANVTCKEKRLRLKVHHLNCGTICPYGIAMEPWVCHCLLIESPAGLVLVDTGFGLADVGDAASRIGVAPVLVGRPKLDPRECAVRQVERLGLSPRDVRHVVVTHLDFDHAGGIADFPHAEVHVFRPEHEAAMRRSAGLEKGRYRAVQWSHGPRWAIHDVDGERWLRFEAVRAIPGTEVLLIPMIGHTRGHCAVAVEEDGGWLLHCGDAYFDHQEMDVASPRCPPAVAAFQRAIAMNNGARVQNQARLRELARDYEGRVRLFCSHSEKELRAFTSLSA